MNWPIQDHADAFLALLRAAPGPALAVHDGAVPPEGTPPYALVYFYVETPDGLAAADKVPLTFNSDVLECWAYVHCVDTTAVGARAVSGRVRSAVLNVTPVVTGRTCFPIRWRQGQPPQRDESTGPLVMDQVDTYGWTSLPG